MREIALEKAKPIRLLILDVDGVLTSGIIFYQGEGLSQSKGFHVHDGFGIKLLQRANIEVGIISAKLSTAAVQRFQDLNIKHFYLGYENKLIAYETLKKELNFTDKEIAYMGDDLPDLPVLRRVGLAITVKEAAAMIKEYAHLITEKPAGAGAVREVCEFILQAQNHYQSLIHPYLSQ
jgi:3-deoxy-D-manno-octulosonate 8-phosphate phosphatase (KDO 8-P phosphatase)